MTEMSVRPLPEVQALAMHTFQAHCESTFRLVTLICVMPIAAIAVVMAAAFNTEFAAQFIPFILVIWLLNVAYPFLLFGLFRSRTGLWWHFLNAHSGWVGVSLVLTLLLLMMMLDFVLPLIQGRAIYKCAHRIRTTYFGGFATALSRRIQILDSKAGRCGKRALCWSLAKIGAVVRQRHSRPSDST